jgi:hypothetical protein
MLILRWSDPDPSLVCITLFGQNFRFVLGGLSRCFNCSIPRARFASYHHTRETLKRARSCTLLSPQLSLSLTFTSQSLLAFVFYSISALSYLPRARTSAPRRSQATLLYCFSLRCSRRSRFVRPTQSSGVTSHYSVGSRARCPCPALQTPYIYTTSYYWDRFPTVTSSAYVRTLALQKSLTNILQISILIQNKKIFSKEKIYTKTKEKETKFSS